MTDFPIVIPIALVLWSGLVYAEAIEGIEGIIELSNGDRINGLITEQNSKKLTLEHSSLGTLKIKREEITAILSSDQKPIPAEQLPMEEIDDGLLGSGLLVDWKRQLDLGLNGAKGVSDNFNVRIGFQSDLQDEKDRMHYEALYLYSENEQLKSQNRAQLIFTNDWLVTDSKWFLFSYGRLDWDQFKDWDFRVSGFMGPGYDVYQGEVWYLRTRLGIGGNRTFGSEHDFTLEALVGIKSGWMISDKQSIEFESTFFPGISDLGDYRNITTLDWNHEIDYFDGLAVKFGIYNEYDTQQTRGTDFRYHASVLWSL